MLLSQKGKSSAPVTFKESPGAAETETTEAARAKRAVRVELENILWAVNLELLRCY